MKKAEKQKKTAYCFLLAAVLLLTAGILGIGNISSSYVNKAVWNTVIHPRQPVSSNCLTSNGQVILLGELTEERRIEVWFESPIDDVGVLSLELKDPSHGAYLTAHLAEETIELSENGTYGYLELMPTELASELEENVEVDILMTLETETGVLYSVFRLTLPAKEMEQQTPEEVGVGSGETATLTFEFDDVFNVDGVFTVTDTEGIIARYTICVEEAGETDAVVEGNRLWAVPSAEPTKTDIIITVEVMMEEGVAPGETCTVSFTGIYGDGNGEPGNEKEVCQEIAVVVKQPEPEAVGKLPASTLADFSLNGCLPISMIMPENSLMLTASLNGGGLPAFTRYSVDGGSNWYMLYDGGSICVDAAELRSFEGSQSLLLDMHHAGWDKTIPLNISLIAYTEEGLYTGEVVSEATAPLFRTRTATEPLILDAYGSLVFAVSENWAQCETEVNLTHLKLDDDDEKVLYGKVTDNAIRIEHGENNLSVMVGDALPSAGTYCLTVSYYYRGICFAESEITFFVNYSSVT